MDKYLIANIVTRAHLTLLVIATIIIGSIRLDHLRVGNYSLSV